MFDVVVDAMRCLLSCCSRGGCLVLDVDCLLLLLLLWLLLLLLVLVVVLVFLLFARLR